MSGRHRLGRGADDQVGEPPMKEVIYVLDGPELSAQFPRFISHPQVFVDDHIRVVERDDRDSPFSHWTQSVLGIRNTEIGTDILHRRLYLRSLLDCSPSLRAKGQDRAPGAQLIILHGVEETFYGPKRGDFRLPFEKAQAIARSEDMDLDAGSRELLNHGVAPGRIAHSKAIDEEKATQITSPHLLADGGEARNRVARLRTLIGH